MFRNHLVPLAAELGGHLHRIKQDLAASVDRAGLDVIAWLDLNKARLARRLAGRYGGWRCPYVNRARCATRRPRNRYGYRYAARHLSNLMRGSGTLPSRSRLTDTSNTRDFHPILVRNLRANFAPSWERSKLAKTPGSRRYHLFDFIHSHVRLYQMQANESVACEQALVLCSSGQGRRRGR